MNALGRIFFLILTIASGLWFLLGLGVELYLASHSFVGVALPFVGAIMPLLLLIGSVWCFRKLAPSDPNKKESQSPPPEDDDESRWEV